MTTRRRNTATRRYINYDIRVDLAALFIDALLRDQHERTYNDLVNCITSLDESEVHDALFRMMQHHAITYSVSDLTFSLYRDASDDKQRAEHDSDCRCERCERERNASDLLVKVQTMITKSDSEDDDVFTLDARDLARLLRYVEARKTTIAKALVTLLLEALDANVFERASDSSDAVLHNETVEHETYHETLNAMREQLSEMREALVTMHAVVDTRYAQCEDSRVSDALIKLADALNNADAALQRTRNYMNDAATLALDTIEDNS